MKINKKNYNKLKRYWRSILKPKYELDISKWKKDRYFDHLINQKNVVNYLVKTNNKLKQTYETYQNIIYTIQNNNYPSLKDTLYDDNDRVSNYIKAH